MELKKTKEILKNFDNKRIMVIGDLMLDQYIFGNVSRISPEAPVQVLEVQNEKLGLGGAANVSNNIKSLGATPVVLGIVGNDIEGNKIKKLFKERKIDTLGIFQSEQKPTIQKKRIIARNQQLIRIDYEKKDHITPKMENKLINFIKQNISELDAIILQDYNKGLLTKNLIQITTELASRNNVLVGVDPKKDNFFSYKNVTLFKPNRAETETNLNIKISDTESLLLAAKNITKKIDSEYLIITLGEKGLFVYEQDGSHTSIPTFTQEVYDVTGAGDTVISSLMLALATGCNIVEAATIANHAAGVVCEKVGAKPATRQEIISSFKLWNNGK